MTATLFLSHQFRGCATLYDKQYVRRQIGLDAAEARLREMALHIPSNFAASRHRCRAWHGDTELAG